MKTKLMHHTICTKTSETYKCHPLTHTEEARTNESNCFKYENTEFNLVNDLSEELICHGVMVKVKCCGFQRDTAAGHEGQQVPGREPHSK